MGVINLQSGISLAAIFAVGTIIFAYTQKIEKHKDDIITEIRQVERQVEANSYRLDQHILISSMQSSDRWTCAMEVELNNQLRQWIRSSMPELTNHIDLWPSPRQIQRDIPLTGETK